MAHSTTLPILAGLTMLGAVAGVQLGRSAVADIDPIHYGEPDTKFHADLVPYRSAGQDGATLLAAREDVPITSCIGCRAFPEEYRPIHDPAVDGLEDGWSASAGLAAAPAPVEAEPAAPAAAPDPEREAVTRYASYPISEEAATPAEAEAGAAD